jgi:hypothetical protein
MQKFRDKYIPKCKYTCTNLDIITYILIYMHTRIREYLHTQICTYIYADRQTDRQTGRQVGRQVGR